MRNFLDNASDEYMDVMPEDNISQESDLQYLDACEHVANESLQ